MNDDTQSKIEKRAFEIWQREGCPEGQSETHWRQAEAEIEQEAATTAKPKKAATKSRAAGSKAKAESGKAGAAKADAPKKAAKRKK